MTTAPSEPLDLNRYADAAGGRRRPAPGAGPAAPPGKLFDREPPASPEAEMSLLGSMILDPRVITDVMPVVRGPEAFYDPAHAAIYAGILSVFDRGNTVDLTQLLDLLRGRGELERVGGIAYLEKLALEVPTAANAVHFARLVADKHRLRRLIDAAGQTLYEVYHHGRADGEDAKNLIDAAEQRVFEIAQEEQVTGIEPLSALLMQEYERLMEFEDGRAASSGALTGFHDLDRDLGGLQGGEMIIIAARPSMGKTSFVLNIAEQLALGTDTPGSTAPVRDRAGVGIFSLEMSKAQIAQRLLSAWSGIDQHRIRTGQLSKQPHNDEYALLLEAAQHLGHAPIFIDDSTGLSVMSLRARARRMVAQHKVGVILIDYLQLLSSPAHARESRQVEVGAISRAVKSLARELKVPVVALSQLNRGPESRDQNRPRLSDLRESGSLEQDADVVLLLHREEYYHIGDEDWKAENPDKLGVAEIIIAKQRNGPTGTVKLAWDASTTRFKNLGYASRSDSYAPAQHPQGAPYGQPHPQPAPTEPGSRRGGWSPGRQLGPAAHQRDGGGPDRAAPFATDDEADHHEPPAAPF
ncbi:MAG: replicative DNA helicase [Planctomyces sp.]|nr:replicative DNA helicase [Planctomyces sp.]MBA4039535.1 replicative DNA helicase [Planctomyces sp.]MBA4120476.1 replicative DNA helicase [Isosphaera sp.]